MCAIQCVQVKRAAARPRSGVTSKTGYTWTKATSLFISLRVVILNLISDPILEQMSYPVFDTIFDQVSGSILDLIPDIRVGCMEYAMVCMKIGWCGKALFVFAIGLPPTGQPYNQ